MALPITVYGFCFSITTAKALLIVGFVVNIIACGGAGVIADEKEQKKQAAANEELQEKQEMINQENVTKANDLLAQATQLVNDQKINEATSILDEAKKLDPTNESISSLHSDITSLNDEEFLKKSLTNLSDEEFEALTNSALQKDLLSNKILNNTFLEKLKGQSDKRSGYLEEIKKAEEEKEAAKKAEEEKVAQEKRVERIENQFSVWDGSHRNLTRMIKDSMNDPKSYDHVETRYSDMGDYLIVITAFRGSNAFGAIVKNTVKAKVSLDGDVLEIIEEF